MSSLSTTDPHAKPADPQLNNSSSAPTNPQSESSSPAAAGNPKSEGRPRTLTPDKRREFLSLITAGLGMGHAAKHIGCSLRTIRREIKRDPDFAFDVECSEKAAPLNPLKSLHDFAQENWRAAAWLLERLFPERFARRPQASAFGKRQARQLLNEVLQIINAEVIDTNQRERAGGRIRTAFEYLTHVYCAPNRSTAGLRRAIEFFERKEKQNNPFADFGHFAANFNSTDNPPHDVTATTEPEAHAPNGRTPRHAQPQTIGEAFQDLIDDLKGILSTASIADTCRFRFCAMN